ncbi:MAG: pentapeptide repeat-containing protein [Bacteroidales bacterium]|nr:pentapeptide repeat-containing protein [Bacteroidales bacterium]
MTDFKSNFWRKTVTDITWVQFPCNFQDANVVGIDFSGKKLTDSRFVNATVRDCNYAGCDLQGVNFFGAVLDNCDFTGARIWTHGPVSWHTTFPDDVSGCVFDDDGRKALQCLGKLAADAKDRARAWMDSHPARGTWQPGSKLDSPWDGFGF